MSNLPCPLTIPPHYGISLNLIGYISTPINILAFYLVWFQSPNMSTYRYCLTYLQTMSSLVELYLSNISPTYFFFPMLGGLIISENFLKYFHPHHSTVFWLFFFTLELSAFANCFVYRNYCAITLTKNSSKSLRIPRILFILFCHTNPIISTYLMSHSKLTFEQQFNSVKQNYPQCMTYLQYQGFCVYDYKINPWVSYTGFTAISISGIGTIVFFLLTTQTVLILQKMRTHMSEQTYKMHKSALLSLIMQCILPSVFLLIPIYFLLFVVYNQLIEYHVIASHMFFLFATHSMVSSIVMMVTIPKYRQFLATLFSPKTHIHHVTPRVSPPI